jgi:hypothetical protein
MTDVTHRGEPSRLRERGADADEDRAEGPRSEASLPNNAIPAPCSYMPDTMSRSPEAISFAATGVPMAHLGRASWARSSTRREPIIN